MALKCVFLGLAVSAVLLGIIEPIQGGFCDGKQDGNYADPDNCYGYISCSNGIPHEMPCPDKLRYNERADRCEEDAPCPSDLSSCRELHQHFPSFESGVYELKICSEVVRLYCEMGDSKCGCGGWTLVMKTDGAKSTFGYDSSLWSNKESYNPQGGQTGFDKIETKLPTYWNTPFIEVCLGMMVDNKINFAVIRKQASSLYSLIADGQYRATTLGRDKWKSLIGPSASLQLNCNREGFNAQCTSAGFPKARIGFLANNENTCTTCDSRIAFGATGKHDNSNTCGNNAAACCNPDNGGKNIKAMGYILVQ